jgi:hypothetical protein
MRMAQNLDYLAHYTALKKKEGKGMAQVGMVEAMPPGPPP